MCIVFFSRNIHLYLLMYNFRYIYVRFPHNQSLIYDVVIQ